MEYNDILIAPVLTEKSTELREQGKYCLLYTSPIPRDYSA